MKNYAITFVAIGDGQIDLSGSSPEEAKDTFKAFQNRELVRLINRFEIQILDIKEVVNERDRKNERN